MSEDQLFEDIKYKRYAANNIWINYWWLPANTHYWVNDRGEIHRENGPAIISENGDQIWCLNGVRLSIEKIKELKYKASRKA